MGSFTGADENNLPITAEKIAQNYTACADFPNVVAQRHIWGGVPTQRAVTPKFELGRYFRTMHLPTKFHQFTRSEAIVLTNKQTNKQTPLKTSNALRYATTLDNK